jgi:hypothetical protein
VALLFSYLLADAGPAGAEAGFTFDVAASPVTSVGGNGGSPFARTDCPDGSIATGVRASVADNDALWATQFSLECHAIDSDGTALDSTADFTSPARGNPIGTVPDSEQVISCPDGEVLTGLQAYATTEAPEPWSSGTTPLIITETFPRCRALDLGDVVPVLSGPTTQVATELTAGGPATESQLAVADCPSGEFIVGFGGREGWAVDKFEPYCGTLQVSGLTPGITATSFAMPLSTVEVTATRDGGDTITVTDGTTARVWPGDYTGALTVDGSLDPAWYSTTTCSVSLADGDSADCALGITGKPDVAVSLVAPATVRSGAWGTVAATVENVGPAAGAATVEVTVPAESAFGTLPAGCTASGSVATCTTASLAGATTAGGVGGQVVLNLPVTARYGTGTTAGSVSAAASATGDGVASNDLATQAVTVERSAAPSPGIPVLAPTPAAPAPVAPTPAATTPRTAPPVPTPVLGGRTITIVDGAPRLLSLPFAGTRPVASAATPSGTGAWAVTAHGLVSAQGEARTFGSLHRRLNAPVTAIAPTPSGQGYILVAADGGVFAFGDAPFLGSAAGRKLASPIVWASMSCSGRGQYLVSADGGVLAFGDARFHGSMAGRHLNAPVVGLVPRCDDRGYWLVAADGGVFSFGDVPFKGSTGARPGPRPIVAMAVKEDGAGYWLVDGVGTVSGFGTAG